MITEHDDDAVSWNPSSWRRTCLSYIIHTMDAHDLTMQLYIEDVSSRFIKLDVRNISEPTLERSTNTANL